MNSVGVVAIGRNEGDRLRQCLSSVVGLAAQVVYVDSGSTDGSVELARSLGAEVVALDLSIPFTAARARNAGFARLLELLPQVEFVQFVDGDCEVVAGWLEQAAQALRDHPDWAVVCGRRRERFPDATLYNRLCDIEWNTPVGEAKACGGDALMRVAAVQQVGGYNPTLIAGEEPELCVRLRQQGWKIFRLDAEMTLHDANMTRFAQWWKRTKRAGHAYAEGSWLHGTPPERHWVKETRSIWLWGLGIPLGAIALAPLIKGLSLLLLLGYPVMTYRIYRYFKQQGYKASDALPYAISCVLGKFPGLAGVLQFHVNRLLGRRNALIEYK
ncbi:glycosyltransferase [Thermoleptolyngbya sp. C42_A2020_037]|uniref:glycosyltransferase family 2 protein n=1 Tax=Thermoleptolyngbya sp. C42_A2020_037 TaxID=2747799 RepID=UPI0019EBA220|nr:glycosyltransferase [Thermoleptolyngbya sp. C42_A2020_037]MBF2086011.1 glycosyltransferase family 2 protein [Thermoleptolyngbya sp. C42_A2020_037]